MANIDRIRGPTYIFLSILLLYSILKIGDYIIRSYQLQYTGEVVSLVNSIIIFATTLPFMIYFAKRSDKAPIWLNISAMAYIIINIISLVQVTLFPSGNQVVLGPTKIFFLPIQIFGIGLAIFYWIMLKGYFKVASSNI